MDGLSSVEYEDHVYVPFRIEYVSETPYLVFYLEPSKHTLKFVQRNERLDQGYKGALNLNNRSYLFYEITQTEREFLSSDQEPWWKVTLYELLYTREVAGYTIHPECVDLFKAYPTLGILDGYETPIVSYIGVGVSEINEQILLVSKNEKVGVFGKGYYFTSYENALYDAYYKEETDDYLLKLENTSHLDEHHILNEHVLIKDHSFYHGTHYLGKVPDCKKNIKYFIYYYDDEVIYLKSTKPHECKKEIQLRKESGYVMRYILFLKNHSLVKKSGMDSYASDSNYMVKSPDDFICLSYHFIKKK